MVCVSEGVLQKSKNKTEQKSVHSKRMYQETNSLSFFKDNNVDQKMLFNIHRELRVVIWQRRTQVGKSGDLI